MDNSGQESKDFPFCSCLSDRLLLLDVQFQQTVTCVISESVKADNGGTVLRKLQTNSLKQTSLVSKKQKIDGNYLLCQK